MTNKLKELKLTNFRAFSTFTIRFDNSNFLIGPNNAGKTTVLTALRIADSMIRYSHTQKETHKVQDGDKWLNAYYTVTGDHQSVQESIHHNFEQSEARMELTWTNGNKLTAIWPSSNSEESPYFYLLMKKRTEYLQPLNTSKVRDEFERLGVVPLMSPVEYREHLLQPKYVKLSVDTKLASRHFRNNLYLLHTDGLFDSFKDFLTEWMPDTRLQQPITTFGEKGQYIDVYYKEDESGPEKELVWSGDGIQIWLQILFHVFRIGTSKILILDEPEVYLHADLQRRLVRLLNSIDTQIILATHSAEIIAETDSSNIVMIDKQRKHGLRMKDDAMLDMLTETVGTSLNLRLVKALKSQVVLFVEGKDMKTFSLVCARLGLKSLEREYNITTIILNGKSGSSNVIPFRWLHENILSNTKKMFVILDRDYQSEEECNELEKSFEDSGVRAHIWRRKELESYFINSVVISKIIGVSMQETEQILLEASDKLENIVLSQIVNDHTKRERKMQSGKDWSQIFMETKGNFDTDWKNISYRIEVTPAKKLISEINIILSKRYLPTISAHKLATKHSASDIPDEMARLLREINDSCSADTA